MDPAIDTGQKVLVGMAGSGNGAAALAGAATGVPSWPCEAVLADGAAVHLRTISSDDGPRLVAFHSHLSPETVYLRFFGAHPRLSPAEIDRFTHVDGRDRLALVATLDGDIIGIARYDRSETDPRQAEVALVIRDDHQQRGLGTLLLEQLANHARAAGIRVFQAETLPQNAAMLDVFRNAGFEHRAHYDRGVVDVRMDITPTKALEAAIEARHRRAAGPSIE
jgi:RimJ/RimL family protein N-acetyltransferase